MSTSRPIVAVNNVILGNRFQDAVAEIVVEQFVDRPSRFSVKFDTDLIGSDYKALNTLRLQPTFPRILGKDALVTIVVPMLPLSKCLIHGPITSRRTLLKDGGTGSFFEIAGMDRCIEMDREARQQPHPSVTASLAATTVLLRYFKLLKVDQTSVLYSPTDRTLNQVDTDFKFIRSIARNNGLSFWISFGCQIIPPAVIVLETANLRTAPARTHAPGSAISTFPPTLAPLLTSLRANVGIPGIRNNSIGELNATSDWERPTNVLESRIDDRTGISVPVAVANSSAGTPLFYSSALPPTPAIPLGGAVGLRSLQQRGRVPSPGAGDELRARADAALGEASFFTHARTKTTQKALGGILQAGSLVPVRGVGKQYSGSYFVSSVKHTINEIEHVMEMDLMRSGLGPALPI